MEGGDRIKAGTVERAVNALLKWRRKRKRGEEPDDDFMYLTLTLNKITPKKKSRIPHIIPLRHSLLSGGSDLNICLIVDGKKITVEAAHRILTSRGTVNQVFKLSKLKSDYRSFESKKKLYDSFDLFLATVNVVPFLDKVLGKVFYGKKKKTPVPVDLRPYGSNWTEEIDRARRSSLLYFSGGTCSAMRVGKWGLLESQEIVENVFEAIDGAIMIMPKKWEGVRCFHLKFSDSLALPIYDPRQSEDQPGAGGEETH